MKENEILKILELFLYFLLLEDKPKTFSVVILNIDTQFKKELVDNEMNNLISNKILISLPLECKIISCK